MSDLNIPDNGEMPLMHSSSLIGIVTAIIGNVIISIALNLQRYAHLKLKKEAEAETAVYDIQRMADHNDDEDAYDADAETGQLRVADLERQADAIMVENAGQSYFSGVQPGEDGASIMSKSTEGDVRLQETNERGTEWYLPNRRARRKKVGRADTVESTADSTMESSDRLPKYMKSGHWWLGIALMATGETGNFLAYGFAPASTVSPLGVVALISNCVVAPIFFHENFRPRDFAGVAVAIAGAVTVVLASNPEEDTLDPHSILAAVSQLSFRIYVVVTLSLMCVLAGLSSTFGARFIVVDIALVALFGGYTALSTKAVSSLLSYSLIRIFTFPITYALLAVLVFTAVMQVKYLSRALQHFESTQVIPTHFVFFTLSVIFGSAILYQDFDGASSEQVLQFTVGCVLTFVGVWLITSNRKPDKKTVVNADEGEFFSTVASVNLDRSAGARTPTSFYDEDADAEEIVDATEAVRTAEAIPTATPETRPLLGFLPSSRYGSSPGTSSRAYVGGTAGMGLIVDSVVRDRMRQWEKRQHQQQQREAGAGRYGSTRRRITAEPTAVDSRTAPLYRAQTRGNNE
ncbi:magnesium transporter NIPA-domain-containing protein [Lipomyces arxii]|uniref:magnesium transporter NIPA-domain-containing protein n=1 Tax=Lipomyces arxii TaxID=56418 RepID=UPI0034CE411C